MEQPKYSPVRSITLDAIRHRLRDESRIIARQDHYDAVTRRMTPSEIEHTMSLITPILESLIQVSDAQHKLLVEATQLRAELRVGLLHTYTPDPGFWVCFRGEKFYGVGNKVFIEGREKFAGEVFGFPTRVKVMDTFPDGVRVLTEDGLQWLISGGPEIGDMLTHQLSQEEIYSRDHWRESWQ